MKKRLVFIILFLAILCSIFIVVTDINKSKKTTNNQNTKKVDDNKVSEPQTIAIIDSGANLEEVNYDKKIKITKYNALDESEDVKDNNKRGTILFSALYNDKFSMNKKNDLMVIKAFEKGSNIDVENITKGLKYACDNGANIVNMSYSLTNDTKLEEQIKKCQSKNITIITLVDKLKTTEYPANYDGVISVSNDSGTTSDIVIDPKDQVTCLKNECRFNNAGTLSPIYATGYLVDYKDKQKELSKVSLKPIYIK